jgi:hypothetical protein
MTHVCNLFTEPAWEFMKKLEDIEGQERQKAIFECDVSDPEAEVSWFRDEKVRSRTYCKVKVINHGQRSYYRSKGCL